VKEAMAKEERRAKHVRIIYKSYNEPAKLGDVTDDDFEDVIARLPKYYKERESKQRT
jgi:hypothetical protein